MLRSSACAVAVLTAIVVGCSAGADPTPGEGSPHPEPASSPDAAAPVATADAADAPPDGNPASTVTSLGTVHDVQDVTCDTAGTSRNARCQTFAVTCAGVEDLSGSVAITEPAQVTRTVVILGPGGGTHFYDRNPGFVEGYVAKGFRVVQLKWSSDWEKTASGKIGAAACRPSTLFHWAKTTLPATGSKAPFCVHGSSGGSGALGFALARYGLKSEIDHALFSFGPVFSRIDYGCAPSSYSGPKRNLCPEDTNASATYTPNSRALIDDWEGTQGCAASPKPADLPRWSADSIVTPSADFAYDHTSLSFFYCVAPANAGAGQGSFFIEAARSPTKHTRCFNDCPSEELTGADVTEMVDDMDQNCVLHP